MTDWDATAALAGSDYAQRSREMINLVKDLRALGADAEVDLPRIAVIGNQSAGKSSLVEAIADIKVPRAAGTCTRCPMEFRLSYSESAWCSQISLRFEKSKTVPNVLEQKFGPIIHSKNELEDMLRRAQMAVLNPSTSTAQFETADLKHKSMLENELSFSPNVVCVDVSGPDVPDLSFIDLPGLVSNEERDVIDLVRNLILDHITGNALILLTITMRDDIQNQSAALLAKEVDPQGLRTVGVLTKPDTLQPGEESGWLDILHGRKHRLHHGYFVTKQPGPEELLENLAHAEARKREASYFTSTLPWRTVLQTTKSRVGVPNLTTQLSKLLTERISEALPDLRSRSLASLRQARDDLSSLPEPPSDNILSDLLRLVGQFEKSISDCVGGSIHEPSVMQHCRATYDLFREHIKETTPEFTVDDTPDSSQERPRSAKDVQVFIKNHITRELPFDVPFDAKAHLIHQCLEDWPHFVEACADAVFLRLGELLDVKIEQTFGRFANLKESVSNVVNELLNEIHDNAAKHLQWLLSLENYPFTLNTHYLESYREKYLQKYQEERSQATPDENDQPAEAASPEIVLMAEVRAYFQVAYKRIIDNVPRALNCDGLIALSSRVNAALVRGLGIDTEGSSTRLKEYFAEDSEVSDLRAELQAKQKRLEEITTRLSGFSGKSDPRRVSVARSSFRLDASSPLSPFRATNSPKYPPSNQLTVHNGSNMETDDLSPQSTAVSPEPQDFAHKDPVSPAPPAIDPEEIYASERKKVVESALESLLNQVTSENLDTMSDQVVAWANSPEHAGDTPVLSVIVLAVVRKSITTVAWVEIGISICEKLINKVGDHVKGTIPSGETFAGRRLVSSYVIRHLNTLLAQTLLKSTIADTIEERKASDFNLAVFMQELLEMGVLGDLSLLKYLEIKFKNKSTLAQRGMELSYAILKSCGRLLDIHSIETQKVFTAIEQRMEEVSPHLKLMLQELIDLRARNWMDSPDDADTSDD
ncbi:P-loop containing nucleoside triphosphate hydrolase protein [Hymenopellis radicata]|nr:P-loop containing nucleoside triphosphate hydrolase protein [Hymenopellis radicata]